MSHEFPAHHLLQKNNRTYAPSFNHKRFALPTSFQDDGTIVNMVKAQAFLKSVPSKPEKHVVEGNQINFILVGNEFFDGSFTIHSPITIAEKLLEKNIHFGEDFMEMINNN